MSRFSTVLIAFLFICQNSFAVQAKAKNKSIKTLVVIYSYTGNTKSVADMIIKRFNADMIEIKAKKYETFGGGYKASFEAWNEVKTTDITPETVELSKYDLIFLGSPIWWYRPAVPLWSFVGKNTFKGNRVVLFNTFNSRFKQNYIEKFKKSVVDKGGEFIDHIYVRRGRWYNQLNKDELMQEFTSILDKKEGVYEGISI